MLLEARALSDMKRTDLALEVIANIDRREAIRLRSDILWAGKRYGESAEQIELLYGERWKDFEPLGDAERSDILRAAIGYALAEDAIGLGRLREKYTPKMTDAPTAAPSRSRPRRSAPMPPNSAKCRRWSRRPTRWARSCAKCAPAIRNSAPCRASSRRNAAQKPAPQKAAMRKPKPADLMPTGSILPDQRRLKR